MNRGIKSPSFYVPASTSLGLTTVASWQLFEGGPVLLPLVAFTGAVSLVILAIKTLKDEARHRFDTKTVLIQQRALDRSRRLAVVGELAGGIVNEVQAPLAAIQSITEMLKVKSELLSDPKHVKRTLDHLLNRMDRVAITIKALQNFSRREFGEERRVEAMETLVREAIALNIFRLKQAGVALRVNFNGLEQSPIFCRIDEFIQSVMTLLVNAIEAVNGDHDAWVEIEYHEQGNTSTLVVRNSGALISNEVAARMFEPGFTTKRYVRGAGLGLSVAHDLIKSNGGDLVHNPNAKHVSFEIRMPKAHIAQSSRNDPKIA